MAYYTAYNIGRNVTVYPGLRLVEPKQDTMRDSADDALNSLQLADELRQAISDGRYSAQRPLPSYREMGKRYLVGLRTVRGALDILEQDGLLYRKERSGTFVRGSAAATTKSACSKAFRCINVIEDVRLCRPPHLQREYLAGYTEALEDHDIKMRFTMRDSGGDERFGELLSDRQPYAEQACLLMHMFDAKFLSWLNERHIPYVVQCYYAYPQWGLPPHSSVYLNKTRGAAEGTKYLLSLGHRRIGFMGALPGGPYPPVVYEGYRAAMICAGFDPCPDDLVDFATDERTDAVRPATEFLQRKDRPTAILCQTDSMALGVLSACKSLGIGVPTELSVMGFNNQIETEISDPPLTTVAVPSRLLARTAIEMLLSVVAGWCSAPQTRSLNCRLVTRRSTAVCATS